MRPLANKLHQCNQQQFSDPDYEGLKKGREEKRKEAERGGKRRERGKKGKEKREDMKTTSTIITDNEYRSTSPV